MLLKFQLTAAPVTVKQLTAIYKYQAIIGDEPGYMYVQIEGNLANRSLHDVENKHIKELSIIKTATGMLSSFMLAETLG